MYAIIATGGKQYKVSEGDIIKVEKLNAEKDATVTFDVVVVSKDSDVICGDAAKSATVKATVLGEGKAKKVVVFKYRPKKDSKSLRGHRQPYTKVKIEKIHA